MSATYVKVRINKCKIAIELWTIENITEVASFVGDFQEKE